ncbi:MAG: MerR family transcriptional regulator [Verrucomicrobium sp.]|jgi:methanogenic corrinoid protein MtbC1|nr:MerR family transcriptional regulator [Verrucomicrobium sp.]
MSDSMVRHSIRTVARQTGLSPHVIRAWEKRYQTVRPARSEGKQRLYSESDIERLILLREATEAGFSIGTIASLSVESLRGLVSGSARGGMTTSSAGRVGASGFGASGIEADARETLAPAAGPSDTDESGSQEAFRFLEGAFQSVLRMDAAGLEGLLERASVAMGQMRLLGGVIVPLVERIGDGWMRGEVKVSQEHVATSVLRTFLGNIARPIALHPRAPVLVVTTPAGQIHELGAIIVAAAATGLGWRVVYGGASLPAEEIAGMAIEQGARAVGLSLVHPTDDPRIALELQLLRRMLPASTRILVGGRASGSYRSEIDAVGATRVGSLEDLRDELNRLRGDTPGGTVGRG